MKGFGGVGVLFRLNRGGDFGTSLAGGVRRSSASSDEAAVAAAAAVEEVLVALATASFSEPHRRVNRDCACTWTRVGAIAMNFLPAFAFASCVTSSLFESSRTDGSARTADELSPSPPFPLFAPFLTLSLPPSEC
jgi:hypothetical protein